MARGGVKNHVFFESLLHCTLSAIATFLTARARRKAARRTSIPERMTKA
jgi:hypothetical protein